VDVAVMAPVAPYLHKVPCLIGGPGAAALAPRAAALGMKMEFVSAEVGQASAIKMFRSIVVKGLEALLLESMLAASEYEVEARVLASLKETYPGIDWEKLSGYMIERVVSHGKRRAAEMREVAETLEGVGLEHGGGNRRAPAVARRPRRQGAPRGESDRGPRRARARHSRDARKVKPLLGIRRRLLQRSAKEGHTQRNGAGGVSRAPGLPSRSRS